MQCKTPKIDTNAIMFSGKAFPPQSANNGGSNIGKGTKAVPVTPFNLQRPPSGCGGLFSDLANKVIGTKRVCLEASPSKISHDDISNLESKIKVLAG